MHSNLIFALLRFMIKFEKCVYAFYFMILFQSFLHRRHTTLDLINVMNIALKMYDFRFQHRTHGVMNDRFRLCSLPRMNFLCGSYFCESASNLLILNFL